MDVAGYRERRSAALKRFSVQIAEEVLASGQEKALEPMSPADRKAVHDAMNQMPGVQTRSEGEDPNRHIVIVPAGSHRADARRSRMGATPPPTFTKLSARRAPLPSWRRAHSNRRSGMPRGFGHRPAPLPRRVASSDLLGRAAVSPPSWWPPRGPSGP